MDDRSAVDSGAASHNQNDITLTGGDKSGGFQNGGDSESVGRTPARTDPELINQLRRPLSDDAVNVDSLKARVG